MTYRTDNKIRSYAKGYGLMSFPKNLGNKYGKNIINKGMSIIFTLIKVNIEK